MYLLTEDHILTVHYQDNQCVFLNETCCPNPLAAETSSERWASRRLPLDTQKGVQWEGASRCPVPGGRWQEASEGGRNTDR